MKTQKKDAHNIETIENDQTVQTVETQQNDELLKAFNLLKSENEKLKAAKTITLNFEEAAELFRKKAKMLDEITQFEAIKLKISNIDFSPESKNPLNDRYYCLGLAFGDRDFVFKISNMSVITEFIDFVFNKLTSKIDALKLEVQEL